MVLLFFGFFFRKELNNKIASTLTFELDTFVHVRAGDLATDGVSEIEPFKGRLVKHHNHRSGATFHALAVKTARYFLLESFVSLKRDANSLLRIFGLSSQYEVYSDAFNWCWHLTF